MPTAIAVTPPPAPKDIAPHPVMAMRAPIAVDDDWSPPQPPSPLVQALPTLVMMGLIVFAIGLLVVRSRQANAPGVLPAFRRAVEAEVVVEAEVAAASAAEIEALAEAEAAREAEDGRLARA